MPPTASTMKRPSAARPARHPSESPSSPTTGSRKGGPRLIRWHQELWRDIAEITRLLPHAPQDHSLKNVVWHGPTPHDKLMNEILPAADLMATPTRNDTFLIAAQEAQLAGLPVITSRMAGIPEVVRHGRTGLLCDRDDDRAFVESIGRLLTDHTLRRRMGREAHAFAAANLSATRWHNHLFDQLIALADGRPLRYAPQGVDIRRSDDEPASPATALESLQMTKSTT